MALDLRPVDSTESDHVRAASSARSVGQPWWTGRSTYLLVAFVAGTAAFLFYRPGLAPGDGPLLARGINDLAWMQAMFESLGRAGPFGVDPHLAFPDGFSPWSHPVLGVFASVFAWLSVGVLGLPSATSLWLFATCCCILNSVATLFFLRRLVGARLPMVAIGLALAIGTSAFFLSRVGHANLLPFFVVPAALGVLVSQRRGWRSVLALAAVALLSGSWWVLVAAVIVVPAALPSMARRRWDDVRWALVTAGALLTGLVVTLLLSRLAAVPGAPADRGPWDSNVFGGHLADVLVASPFLNSRVQSLAELPAGVSREVAQIGLFQAMLAVIAILVVIALPVARVAARSTLLLAGATITSLLLFLTGGLGNAQAAIAVLMGTQAPGRTWSRVLLVLAMLGAAWLLLGMVEALRRFPNRAAAATAAVVLSVTAVTLVAVSWVLDARALSIARSGPAAAVPQAEALKYLGANTEPCPVAQLPTIGLTGGVGWLSDMRSDIYPYLVAPEYSWSYGYRGPLTTDPTSAVGTTLNDAELGRLGEAGFCAVLWDEEHAREARDQGRVVPGRDLGPDLVPDAEAGRYSVILLDR